MFPQYSFNKHSLSLWDLDGGVVREDFLEVVISSELGFERGTTCLWTWDPAHSGLLWAALLCGAGDMQGQAPPRGSACPSRVWNVHHALSIQDPGIPCPCQPPRPVGLIWSSPGQTLTPVCALLGPRDDKEAAVWGGWAGRICIYNPAFPLLWCLMGVGWSWVWEK